MAGNPILGFLAHTPTGNTPRDTVAKMLRLLGIVILVSAGLSIVGSILSLTLGAVYTGATGVAATILMTAVIVALLFTIAFAAAACFWITFTLNAWSRGEARGATHALVIGILATIFGGIGVIGGLMGTIIGAIVFSPSFGVNVLSLLVAAAEGYCGIMILMNRSKAISGIPGATA